MTDRAEIERLLNQTGRTLEGLPTQDDYWYSDDYVDRNEEIGMMMYRSGFKRNEPYIMHQSDVIELLVGALRDALDKPMQQPMTLEEAINSEWTVWVEINGSKKPIAGDVWISKRLEGYAMFAFVGETSRSHAALDRYGKGWRCWASRPTDEEREAAAWET